MTIEQLLEAVRLKELPRAGWVRQGLHHPESVAGHSWGVAWLVLALLPDELDQTRALTYAVLHDLPEVRVGDLTPHDLIPREEKARREQAAMHGLTAGTDRGTRLARLWEAYEDQTDPEAQFVRQLDRLDMALQAVHYAERQPQRRDDLVEFLTSAAKVIEHPTLVPLLEALKRRLTAVAPPVPATERE
ncbi:MAG: HD domain-containing protein [Myxococcota bacterium]